MQEYKDPSARGEGGGQLAHQRKSPIMAMSFHLEHQTHTKVL